MFAGHAVDANIKQSVDGEADGIDMIPIFQ